VLHFSTREREINIVKNEISPKEEKVPEALIILNNCFKKAEEERGNGKPLMAPRSSKCLPEKQHSSLKSFITSYISVSLIKEMSQQSSLKYILIWDFPMKQDFWNRKK
jgi:hypothetical protein